jgi:hypothetical protein
MANDRKNPMHEKKQESPKKPLEAQFATIERKVLSRLRSENVRPFKGEYFSNKQLNVLREVLERKGFAIAKKFQQARIQPKDNRWEQIKNEILLEFLEDLDKLNVDLVTAAFIVGKLNPILAGHEASAQKDYNEEKAK